MCPGRCQIHLRTRVNKAIGPEGVNCRFLFTAIPAGVGGGEGGGGLGREHSREFRIGVCRQGSETLALFKGRKSKFDTLFKAQNQKLASYLREIYLKALC